MTAPEATFGRIPLVVVEIEQELCANVYGTAPCTAAVGTTGSTKCFNTRASCQDAANYAAAVTPLTLRFCEASADIPVDLNVIPNVKGVTTSPTRLNPGGRAGRDKPLGRRAECTVRFVDHPHSDNLVDPYLADRTYKPLERGTFWAKWLKRNPYHNNWPLRVYEGFAGQTLAEMQVRNYLIDKIDGPDSSGNVSIRGVDILRLADNDKAQCPALSTGKLAAAITAADTSLTISGTLAEYTAYSTNVVRIEKEIIRYTGSSELAGIVTLTGLTRGSDGTTAAAHDADDTVQACKEWVAQAPWLVAKELLVDFGEVPTAYVPYTDWTTECGTWLSGLTVTRLISEPTGVTTLLGELSEQCTFYLWWDEYDQEVKLRAVRPSVEVIPTLTEADNLIQNSVKITPHPEYRASEVWVSYLQRNAAESTEKRDNYRRTNARVDQNNFYGERRVYEVFSPWLQSSAAVDMLTFRLLSRYRHPPRYISFALDAKDRSLRTGDVFDLQYRGFSDFTGETEAVRYQVISAHESPPGERVLIEAQKFDFDIGTKYGFWTVDTAPLYSAASDAEKAVGCWWTQIDGTMPDGSDGYVWS